MISETVRKRVIYHGRVQGVGFRASVYDIASAYTLHGFVRNLHDGTVELVVEASPDEVEHFLAAIAERFTRFITKVEETESPSGEDLPPFEIRR